jgi:hypothetical protein
MPRITSWFRKLTMLGRRDQFRSELEEEMAFHRTESEERFIAQGTTPKAARTAAKWQFGSSPCGLRHTSTRRNCCPQVPRPLKRFTSTPQFSPSRSLSPRSPESCSDSSQHFKPRATTSVRDYTKARAA